MGEEDYDYFSTDTEDYTSPAKPQEAAHINNPDDIAELKKLVKELLTIFQGVKKEILDDYEKGKRNPNAAETEGRIKSVESRIASNEEKLGRIMEQNKNIAESIIAIHGLLSPHMEEAEEPLKAEPQLAPQPPEQDMRAPQNEQPMEFQNMEYPRGPSMAPPRPPAQMQANEQGMQAPPQLQQGYVQPQQNINFYDRYPQAQAFPEKLMPPPRPSYMKPAFPTMDEFPELPGQQPEFTKELHVEPRAPKKKFLGVF